MFSFFKVKPLGARGETMVVQFLHTLGNRILDRNVQIGRYEIGIIAQEKTRLFLSK